MYTEVKHRVSVGLTLGFGVVALSAASVIANPDTVDAAKVKVSKVTVTSPSGKTATVAKGKKVTLTTTVKVSPDKKANKKVIYKSKNKKIATVSSKGVVKGVKAGTTKITVVSKKNKKIKTTLKIVVKKNAVKKIKLNTGNFSIAAGASKTVKATVTPGKNVGTKVVWTSNNKKVATVSSKGVIKGIKAGTATITAKATDGSGKKASLKVTVTASAGSTINLTSMTVQNSRGIAFKLSAAKKLAISNIVVKKKAKTNGTYQKTLKVNNLTTTNSVDYQIVLDEDSQIIEGEFVQLTISVLNGKTRTMEKQYREANAAYQTEVISRWTQDEYGTASFYFSDSEDTGYSSFSVTGLPAGLTSETKYNYLYVKGTPTTAGVKNATVKATDEYGNTDTRTIHFIIGSDSKIVGAANAEYGFVTDNGSKFSSDSNNVWFTGGSGTYKYEITNKGNTDAELKTESSSGTVGIRATLAAPGTYNIKIKATDVANTKLSCEVTLPIHIIQGVSIAGIVKDANGNPLSGAYIAFTNKNKADKYTQYYYTYTDSKGSYSVKLSPGNYDIVAITHGPYSDYSEAATGSNYLYKQNLNATKSGFDITLPVYKVTLISGVEDYTINSGEDWYISDEYVGNGNMLYLKAGTYEIQSSKYYDDSSDAKESQTGTWWNGMTVTKTRSRYVYAAKVTVKNAAVQASVTKKNVKGQLTESTVYGAAKNTPESCDINETKNLSSAYSYDDNDERIYYYAYKFEAPETVKYKINTSSGDTVKFYDLNTGNALTPDGDYYNLTAGTTYIVGNGACKNSTFSITIIAEFL